MRGWIELLILCLIVLGGCNRRLADSGDADSALMDVVANKVDSVINPADNFFDWANNGWFKAFPMPPSESQWGIEALASEEIFQNTINICRNASLQPAMIGTLEQKIGDLWATGMDTISIETQGINPILPFIKKISTVKNIDELFAISGELYSYEVKSLFHAYVYQDKKYSDKYAFYLEQGGLGLFDREYYINDSKANMKIRWEYVQYIKRAFMNIGESERTAQIHASSILKIETFLAKKHLNLEDLQNIQNSYNKYSIGTLEKQTPSVPWKVMFKNMGLPVDSILVDDIGFLKQINEGIQLFPLEDWKCYLKFWLINTYSVYLPKKFGINQFQFYGGVLEGRKQAKARWKFLLTEEERLLGEGIGHLIVKDVFSEKTKKRYSVMVDGVKEAFNETIMEADWMSASTKIEALRKLKAMKKKVGYPDKWKEFDGMNISRESFAQNILSAKQWWFKRSMAKLTKPVDRFEWNITPQEYSAYYSVANNEIVISASILSIPGFSDDQIDDAVAYGCIAGSTIGHEITHGFDMEGKEYDLNGNLHRWWRSEDSIKYMERVQPLIQQYNKYIAIDSIHCNGAATLDENIADLGGITLALKAFKKTEQYKLGKKKAGYTPLQRFFMGYALGWMNITTKERLTRQVIADNHSPTKWRVNGVLSNIPEFYEAFSVKPHNKMWIPPNKRVKIW
jgi:putative endopeptidase